MKRILLVLALSCAVHQSIPTATAAITERRPIKPPNPEPDHGPTLPPDPWIPI
jgi:hypothetical protein